MVKLAPQAHAAHGWLKQSTDHIHNVAYLTTHDLMLCPCGFFGWVLPEADRG